MPTITTKKVAPKKAVTTKKTAAKKAVTKAVVKKTTKSIAAGKGKKLVYANNQKSFWVTNGQILNSLLALSDALETMEKNVYAHHVNKDRHDFADWVSSVLADVKCAEQLRQAKTVASAETVVAQHLKSYSQ